MLRVLFLLCTVHVCAHAALTGRPRTEAIMDHLRNFEKIAKLHSNSRSVQNGYNASAEYVMEQLNQYSDYYDVETFPFTTPVWTEFEPPTLTIKGVNPTVPLYRCTTRSGWNHWQIVCDFSGIRYGGNGKSTITAKVARPKNWGCYKEDWEGFPKGAIAAMETGECDYYQKCLLAEDYGSVASILYTPEGYDSLPGSRVYRSDWQPGDRNAKNPVVGVAYGIAMILFQEGGREVTLSTNQEIVVEHTFNVIATTKKGSPTDVVMVGSHLDSVPAGPGINDNGSGSATVLETALEMARKNTQVSNQVRFGWWGAEEIGLVGSRNYVNYLVNNPKEASKLALYLNFDMQASPNYVRMVYNGEEAPEPATQGSVKLMKLFQQYYKREGMTSDLGSMNGGSDYYPFILAGIPSGGMGTGAGSLKSVEQRHIHGGLANAMYDPCYHAPCDTVDNIAQDCLTDIWGAIQDVLGGLVKKGALDGFGHHNRTVPSPQRFMHSVATKMNTGATCNQIDESHVGEMGQKNIALSEEL
eukprot:TRINITY_DN62833_c0_g1_i1.p1 TRINITY_DN62833_c0_g1~~TRINITY_DN62833_c0_g1_i1.p1  ORF type:complete len:527 (+),score=90.43 TRINITY_DN62833_c0_g1_i1:31-1611(+)